MRYYIDLDWTDEVSSARFLAKNYNVDIEVIDENGPAGGWPYIRFIGKKNDLIRFIVDVYDTNNSNNDYEDYFADFKEYNEETTCICDHCGAEISDDTAHFGNGAEVKLCDCCYNKLTEDEKERFIYFGMIPEKLKK